MYKANTILINVTHEFISTMIEFPAEILFAQWYQRPMPLEIFDFWGFQLCCVPKFFRAAMLRRLRSPTATKQAHT